MCRFNPVGPVRCLGLEVDSTTFHANAIDIVVEQDPVGQQSFRSGEVGLPEHRAKDHECWTCSRGANGVPSEVLTIWHIAAYMHIYIPSWTTQPASSGDIRNEKTEDVAMSTKQREEVNVG